MSDCGVCIGSGDYDCELEFFDVTWPKAKKDHRCCECRRVIAIGERYARFVGKWDGSITTAKTCELCHEIRDSFSCTNSTVFGQLWYEMHTYVFPEITISCFERLVTTEARSYLQSKWMEWKFSDEHKYQAHRQARNMIAKLEGSCA